MKTNSHDSDIKNMLDKKNLNKSSDVSKRSKSDGVGKVKKPFFMKAGKACLWTVAIKNSVHKHQLNRCKKIYDDAMTKFNARNPVISQGDSIVDMVQKLELQRLQQKVKKLSRKCEKDAKFGHSIMKYGHIFQRYAHAGQMQQISAVNEGSTIGINGMDVPTSTNTRGSDLYNILDEKTVDNNISFGY